MESLLVTMTKNVLQLFQSVQLLFLFAGFTCTRKSTIVASAEVVKLYVESLVAVPEETLK